MPNLIIGVDLGGTKIATAIGTTTGKILHSITIPTEAKKGPKVVLGKIIQSIENLLAYDFSLSTVRGIGIGAPGEVLPNSGVIVTSPNLPGFRNIKLKQKLEAKFKKPVFLDNDANAAALGEVKFGAGKKFNYIAYITISTGIGGGLIINKEIYRGANNVAGEIGHTIIVVDGRQCNCGRRGCLEAYASGWAITQRTKEKIKEVGQKTEILKIVNSNLEAVSPKVVEEAARCGDKLALAIMEETGKYLGIGLANLINIFNPELIIIGGGVSKAWSFLVNSVTKTINQTALSVPGKTVKIVKTKLGNNVGVLGAMALVLEDIKIL